MEEGGFEVQSHGHLHGQLKASLPYMRPCLKKIQKQKSKTTDKRTKTIACRYGRGDSWLKRTHSRAHDMS